MNQELQKSVEQFLQRTQQKRLVGKVIDRIEIEEVNAKLNGLIPDWFINIMTTYPISGIELAYQAYPPELDYDGLLWLELLNSQDIYSETNECYPGVAIQELGYFCIGGDSSGGGNPYFISTTQGDNPPVFQVYHDVSDNPEEIEQEGMKKVAETLSQLFDRAILE